MVYGKKIKDDNDNGDGEWQSIIVALRYGGSWKETERKILESKVSNAVLNKTGF